MAASNIAGIIRLFQPDMVRGPSKWLDQLVKAIQAQFAAALPGVTYVPGDISVYDRHRADA